MTCSKDDVFAFDENALGLLDSNSLSKNLLLTKQKTTKSKSSQKQAPSCVVADFSMAHQKKARGRPVAKFKLPKINAAILSQPTLLSEANVSTKEVPHRPNDILALDNQAPENYQEAICDIESLSLSNDVAEAIQNPKSHEPLPVATPIKVPSINNEGSVFKKLTLGLQLANASPLNRGVVKEFVKRKMPNDSGLNPIMYPDDRTLLMVEEPSFLEENSVRAMDYAQLSLAEGSRKNSPDAILSENLLKIKVFEDSTSHRDLTIDEIIEQSTLIMEHLEGAATAEAASFSHLEPSVIMDAPAALEPEVAQASEPLERTYISPSTPKTPIHLLNTPLILERNSEEDPNPFIGHTSDPPLSGLISKFSQVEKMEYWRYLLLLCCNQKDLFTFHIMNSYVEKDYLEKIGESTFSEVFLYKDEPPFVIKIIPVRVGNEENRDSYYQNNIYKDGIELPYASRACDGYNEVLMTKALSPTSESLNTGFIYCGVAYLLQGKYPDTFLDKWREYDEKEGSENICPAAFSPDQHFLFLTLSYGGVDLEKYKLRNVKEPFSILRQLILAIIYAQKTFEFEHRDLHAGNILIQYTDSEDISMTGADGCILQIPSYGVEIKIIDYTLSRMRPNLKSGKCLFSDLDLDPEFFQGDAKINYQYEMYRQMRTLIYENDEKEKLLKPGADHSMSPWQRYCPKTNAAWIWFVIKILLQKLLAFKKSTPFKKRLTGIQDSLKKLVIEGDQPLEDWYCDHQNSFIL